MFENDIDISVKSLTTLASSKFLKYLGKFFCFEAQGIVNSKLIFFESYAGNFFQFHICQDESFSQSHYADFILGMIFPML